MTFYNFTEIDFNHIRSMHVQQVGSTFHMHAYIQQPVQGMQKGVISDMYALSESIAQALGKLQEKTQRLPDEAFVSFCPLYVELIKGYASLKTDKIINKSLLKLLRKNARNEMQKHPDMVRMNVGIPIYTLDGKHRVSNPIGMKAGTCSLEETYFCISKDIWDNYRNVFNQVIFAKRAPKYKLIYQIAESLCYTDNVLFIDIGCQCTKVIFVSSNKGVRYIKIYPIGMQQVISDLSTACRISLRQAGKIWFDLLEIPLDGWERYTTENKLYFHAQGLRYIVATRLREMLGIVQKSLKIQHYFINHKMLVGQFSRSKGLLDLINYEVSQGFIPFDLNELGCKLNGYDIHGLDVSALGSEWTYVLCAFYDHLLEKRAQEPLIKRILSWVTGL